MSSLPDLILSCSSFSSDSFTPNSSAAHQNVSCSLTYALVGMPLAWYLLRQDQTNFLAWAISIMLEKYSCRFLVHLGGQ